jgi:hypothetical protein
MDETEQLPQGDPDRREFLQSCGRFAATVPPAMTVLLSTSLTSEAIAASTGGGKGGLPDGHAKSGPPETGGPRGGWDEGGDDIEDGRSGEL